MLLSRTIQWKALLLLTVFAANFMVICHCSVRNMTMPAETHACCEKKDTRTPCNDNNGCSGMHAVKFNLLEKQAADPVIIGDLYVSVTLFDWQLTTPETAHQPLPDEHQPLHPPPDYQSLYQVFLI